MFLFTSTSRGSWLWCDRWVSPVDREPWHQTHWVSLRFYLPPPPEDPDSDVIDECRLWIRTSMPGSLSKLMFLFTSTSRGSGLWCDRWVSPVDWEPRHQNHWVSLCFYLPPPPEDPDSDVIDECRLWIGNLDTRITEQAYVSIYLHLPRILTLMW